MTSSSGQEEVNSYSGKGHAALSTPASGMFVTPLKVAALSTLKALQIFPWTVVSRPRSVNLVYMGMVPVFRWSPPQLESSNSIRAY